MKTISVTDEVHEQLTKLQGDLQRKTGKRIDMGRVVETLLEGRKQ